MKKTNFTNPKWVKNLLVMAVMIFTAYSATNLSAQNCQLTYDDTEIISVGTNCKAKLNRWRLGIRVAKCTAFDHMEFQVSDMDGNVLIPYKKNPTIDVSFVGGTYMVSFIAYDASDNFLNAGMMTVVVVDKTAPQIDCPAPNDTIEIKCYEEQTYFPTVTDNCIVNPENLKLIKIDQKVWENNCDVDSISNSVMAIIDRNFIAIDSFNNVSDTCHVVMKVLRITDAELAAGMHFPEDTTISCSVVDDFKDADGKFDPNKTGWPYFVFDDPHPTKAEQAAGDTKDTIILNNSCTSYCNLSSTLIYDQELNNCINCVETHKRLWVVTEGLICDTKNKYGFQTITVIDTLDPVIECPEDVVITTNTINDFEPTSLGDLDCGARFKFPKPVMSDECSDKLTWTITVFNDLNNPIMFADEDETKSDVWRDLPLGQNKVIYRVYDNCRNYSECTWYVTVVDNTPPVAICQQFTTVSLTYDGEAEMPAANFDSGSYDDCAIDSFKVRRMDNKVNCAGDTDDEFHDYVTFCCDDIANNNIVVIMRAFDKSGNYNDCMVQVNVQDKLPPQVKCPPSLCVSCDYAFEIDHMDDYFGTVVQGKENRETHTIIGDYGAFYEAGTCGNTYTDLHFKDGWAYDNCGLTISSSYEDKRTLCNGGNIVRTFTVSDPNGTVECEQIIHFYDPEPFDASDIKWPGDVPLTGCFDSADYGPDVTGWPVMDEGSCDLVGATYKDQVYHFNDDDLDAEGVCFKIIRRWTVMDWCQKNANGTYKTWLHDQVIMISETDAPVFTSDCEDKSTCTYDAECKEGYIELTMSAHDDCTEDEHLLWRYRIDLDNDGSFDIDSKSIYANNPHDPHVYGPNADASDEYPIGTHRIVWTVWDQCGNTAVCDRLFTVKNCKKPTPICLDHVVVEMMPVDQDNDGNEDWAMITVGPKLMEHCCAKSFHPCGYDLTYSFSSNIKDTLRTFDCDSKGLQPLEMWVTAVLDDGTLLQDKCVTQVDFQDNNHVCPANTGNLVNVSGTITTLDNEPMKGVFVELQGSELTTKTTNDDGTYAFTIENNRNYLVAPVKDGEDLNGISTLDLVLIQKHILNINKIDNPYLILAADANHNKKITSSDILILRKLILGVKNNMGKSWLFVPKNYQFENTENPLGEDVPEKVLLTNATSDVVADFYGIKMGDINNSFELRSDKNLVLSIDAMDIVPGEIEVPVYGENFTDIAGFQFTFNFDPSVLQFEGIEAGKLNVTSANFGANRKADGILTMSWFDNNTNAVSISGDDALFILKFKVKAKANMKDVLAITSNVTKQEAYGESLEVMGVNLDYRNADDVFALYQNTPNPFTDYTDISFNLPEDANATLTIFDLNGKVVKTVDGTFNKGVNTVRIKKSDIGTTGVMYYRLQTDSYTATKKMIVLSNK